MKQQGRVSSARLAVVTPFERKLVPAPDDLSPMEADVWSRIVASQDDNWFTAGNMPILSQYCRVVVQAEFVGELVRKVAENLSTDPEELGRYKELRKIQATLSSEIATLSTKMRLAQQSTYNALSGNTATRRAARNSGNKPWQNHDIIES